MLDAGRDRRQFLILDAKGETAAFTGSDILTGRVTMRVRTLLWRKPILASNAVVEAMVNAFEKERASGQGELAEWMLGALQAGQVAGGDKRGQQSAALLVIVRVEGIRGLQTDTWIYEWRTMSQLKNWHVS